MPPHHCWCTNSTYDGLGKYADAPDCTHVSCKRDTETRTKIARLTGAAGMMEVCSGGIWKHSWVIWGPSRAIWDDLGGALWCFVA